MIIKLNELPIMEFEHDFYILEISTKFDTTNEALQFMGKINSMMRYWLNDTNISFIIGMSETGKNAVRYNLKEGKIGRPKTVIHGNKKKPHLHTMLYGEKVCASTLNIARRINKKAKKTVAKAYKAKDSYYAPYIIEQCSNIRKFGSFDFMQLRGGLYIDVTM